jgi:hypothetical protein
LSNNTSDFSLSTASPNTGLKYTGPNALIFINFYVTGNFNSLSCAASVGAGTPAAPAFLSYAQNISKCRNDFNEGESVLVTYYTTINTNQEIALYVGTSGTSFGVYSLRCSVSVVRYV